MKDGDEKNDAHLEGPLLAEEMRMPPGQVPCDGFVGGVRDRPAVPGGVPGEQPARVVRVPGVAGGTPGERQELCALPVPPDPHGASGPSALVPQHRGVIAVVALAQLAEDVSGLGPMAGGRQGAHVLRGRQ